MLLTTMYYALLVSSVHISNVNDLEELQVLKIMFVGLFDIMINHIFLNSVSKH